MHAPPRPELYTVDADGRIMLKGMRCGCGRAAFPHHRFGCERCGCVGGIAPTDFEAIGTLAASARVHLQVGASPKPPFTIGAVKLDAGPMIRIFLADADLRPGQRVRGTFGRVAREEGEPLDLLFDLATSDDATP